MDFHCVAKDVLAFRNKRDWEQFHNPKDLAISICLEAAELLEIFQWSGVDVEVEAKQNKIKEELADLLIYCIYLADCVQVDIPSIVSEKIKINENKYPAEKACGNARKYTDL
ncbi:MAG: nucleotide pyrophosphohydrolase [Coriobacteriia bacterium]|nr:nucleotide pyrophosphohydrolase [Coriobacteriia bacterium]